MTIRTEATGNDLDMIRRVFERERDFHRGRLIDRSDEMVAAFDGPGRAVQCASSIVAIARQSRIAAKAGVHIGECLPCDEANPLIVTSGALAAAASIHEVRVSRTIVDLLAGSGLSFADRPPVQLPDGRSLPVLALS